MPKTYFICSDVHSHYTPLMNSLIKRGFDIDNPNHIFVSLGDIFDRGEESKEIYNFIRYTLPKDRRILIRGNHEDMLFSIKNAFLKLYPKIKDDEFFDWYSIYTGGYFNKAYFSNGTVLTLFNLYDGDYRNYMNKQEQEKVLLSFIKDDLLDWISSDEWCDWYELGQYILTHCFIPLHNKSDMSIYSQYSSGYNLEYFSDWRTSSTKDEIEDSKWGCPWKLWACGYFKEELKKGKKLMVGHWHTSDFFNNLSTRKNAKKYAQTQNPIYSKDGLIGLDTCTALTNKVNVFVLNEEDIKYDI